MWTLLKIISLFVAVLVFAISITKAHPHGHYQEVNVPSQGPIRGVIGYAAWTNASYYKFHGIPYGESPAYTGRFQPPERKKKWQTVYDATEEKPGCPTASFKENSEDCLHLSVYTRSLYRSVPVLVVLHGHMYYESQLPRQPADYFMSKDIVLVVPQFRTGILGFLSTLTEQIPGNAGAFDALLALEWVQENIHAFGGDPRRVTLVGQSGGAIIAHALSISPKVSKNLFQYLILQSGTALSPLAIQTNPVEYARGLADSSQCFVYDLELVEEINECLLRIPTSTLLQNSVTYQIEQQNLEDIGVKLTIEDPNKLLPDKPLELINLYETKKYPMIIGVTKNDGSHLVDGEIVTMIHMAPTKLTSRSYIKYDLISDILSHMGQEDPTGALKSLFHTRIISQSYLSEGDLFHLIPDLIDIAGTVVYKSPALTTAKLNQEQNTYLYSFDYHGQFTNFGYGDNRSKSAFAGGVAHNDENIYLFPWPKRAEKLHDQDVHMAKAMIELWTTFAETGAPYAAGFPNWLPFKGYFGPYMKINTVPELSESFSEEFFATTEDEHSGTSLLREWNKRVLVEGYEEDDE